MKLICPNCGAQYAVDDRVIPESGRDVQCSGCGHTWFQPHPDHDAALTEELGQPPAGKLREPAPRKPPPPPPPPPPPQRRAPDPEPEPRMEAPAPDAVDVDRPAPEPEPEVPVVDVADAREAEAYPGVSDMPDPVSSRRSPDAEAMSVLREEAEREQAARRAEATRIEVQPELDIPERESSARREPSPPAAEGIRRSPAQVVPGDALPGEDERADRAAPRRDLLPDVEEINSTLSPAEREALASGVTPANLRERRMRGTRVGMGLAFFVFGTLAVLYVQAGRVSTAVPEAAEPLQSYVATVDAGRHWLDQTLRNAVGEGQSGAE